MYMTLKILLLLQQVQQPFGRLYLGYTTHRNTRTPEDW